MNDVLEMRTTNLNIRISPLLKSRLIERAAQLGVNLTDYIYHVITKSEMTNAPSQNLIAEHEALQLALKKAQREVRRYDEMLATAVAQMQGKEYDTSNGKVVATDKFQILHIILDTFKLTPQ
jgi:hypothetical protein